jgi:hypothetical protein
MHRFHPSFDFSRCRLSCYTVFLFCPWVLNLRVFTSPVDCTPSLFLSKFWDLFFCHLDLFWIVWQRVCVSRIPFFGGVLWANLYRILLVRSCCLVCLWRAVLFVNCLMFYLCTVPPCGCVQASMRLSLNSFGARFCKMAHLITSSTPKQNTIIIQCLHPMLAMIISVGNPLAKSISTHILAYVVLRYSYVFVLFPKNLPIVFLITFSELKF